MKSAPINGVIFTN